MSSAEDLLVFLEFKGSDLGMLANKWDFLAANSCFECILCSWCVMVYELVNVVEGRIIYLGNKL